MYLKALEIQGFKSFADKTRLTFDKPVTAVVGPNGSGKSNISDAVRWVMGEQSTKALRGGKMEDVIFGGTQRRGPLGFAEVSLILDNSGHTFAIETSEVMITRRYYRSGDSEYYINRQSVRLKDVNELFMDTGLGREGYSIIGQGRIDEILSTKSTDRREIFEAAAGISRFRHRKEESEHKLAKSDESLLRVNDKISELEMQVNPLKEQAEVAKKYLVLRDELRGLEISAWLDTLERLRLESEQLDTAFEASKKELETAQAELEKLYSSNEEFSERTRDKDREAEEVRELISASEAKTAELSNEIAVLNTDLKHNIENIERINEELKEQEGRDSGIKAQIADRRLRVEEITLKKQTLAAEIEAAEAQLSELSKAESEAENELSALVSEKNDNFAFLTGERARLTAIAASMQQEEDRSSGILGEINDAKIKIEDAKVAAKVDADKLEKTKDELQSIKNVMAGLDMRVKSRRAKAEEAGDKKVKLTMELNALKSRISLLTEMEKEFQGYSKSVKIVMQEHERGTIRGIHGPVASLIKTDDIYALPVETALGAAMQNIIVTSEEDGKAAINLLKRRDGGRATFLPMSSIRGNRLTERLEGEAGFRGLAIDLVRFDKKYESIYLNLLGRIAIVEDMDSAIKISRKFSNRFRIVTMDGQVINAGGSMTGGSNSRNAGILSRANELKKLAENEGILSEDLAKAEAAFDELQRTLAKAEYELTVSGDEMRACEDMVLRLTGTVQYNNEIIATMESAYASLKSDAAGLKERLAKSEKEISEIRAKIATAQEKDAALEAAINEKSGGAEKLSDTRMGILDTMSAARTESASLSAEAETLSNAIEELDALRKDLTGGRDQQSAAKDDITRRNEDIMSEIDEKNEAMAAIIADIQGHKDRLTKIAEEKLAIEAERTQRDKAAQEKNKQLLDLERESARLEQKKLAADLEEKQIVDKLWDTYELTRTTAEAQRIEIESLSAAQRKIGELRREISKLGNPNIGAIEEYERVSTRYNYLTEQRDDIEKAKNELLEIIEDITGEMTEIFAREFKLIDESFRKTFTELFGGGRASLELEDPDDILNCGIEIKVQPPGKSLKTLTLLSGGEKAFVAIALYFAIVKVRPTPFVVMDEIEAALDEANVVRFAEYLRNLTSKTQFIVITHRRGTMEEADVLYGVTMQERGISQVLTIDLDEAEKTISK